MKAIILAAGRGTRLRPLTDTIPKPLIQIRGKAIIEYFLEQVYSHVTEIVLIVNYKQEMFQTAFGNTYCNIPITYHTQGDKKGTGGALEGVESEEDILVFYADTIFEDVDIEKLVQYPGYGCLVREVENPEKYGIFSQKENGEAIKVIEKPKTYVGNLANLGVYKFGPDILDMVKNLVPSPRGEYELTDAINQYCKIHSFQLFPISGSFLDISYPDDIQTSETFLRNRAKNILSSKPDFGVSKKLGSVKNFSLCVGIEEKYISQLIDYSQDTTDTALQKNTGDQKRFSEISKIESWYTDNGRYLFTLISDTGVLAGIWWGRPCDTPEITQISDENLYQYITQNKDDLHTNGIRIYPEFRGQRIATPFVNMCMMYYRDIFPNAIMCIDTDSNNIPLKKSYEKSGYQKIGTGESKKSVTSLGTRDVYIQKAK